MRRRSARVPAGESTEALQQRLDDERRAREGMQQQVAEMTSALQAMLLQQNQGMFNMKLVHGFLF